jgi:hypothetical protein
VDGENAPDLKRLALLLRRSIFSLDVYVNLGEIALVAVHQEKF